MPFKSAKQRRFMWSQHPEIAARWEREAKKESRRTKQRKSFKRKDEKNGS